MTGQKQTVRFGVLITIFAHGFADRATGESLQIVSVKNRSSTFG